MILALGLLLGLAGCAAEGPPPTDPPAGPSGPYLGQAPPGATPQVFAPGIVSTRMDELNSVFSPDERLFLYSVKLPDRRQHVMLYMELREGRWSEPRTLPFSGRYHDADPAFSPDGRRVFFISQRPLPGTDEPKADWDLWSVERAGDAWSEPEHLGRTLNTDSLECYPSLTRDGTLYFCSGREGGHGSTDIWRARLADGVYGTPENLGPAINSAQGEGDVYVAPDESYIVFVSGRDGGVGSNDLWVSFREEDDSWSPARNMGEPINSNAVEYCPVVSPDGRYLFFTSYRRNPPAPDAPLSYQDLIELYDRPGNTLGDIYWVDASVIHDLR